MGSKDGKFRNSSVRESDFSWTVIENETGLAYVACGIPVKQLSKERATALTNALNEAAYTARTIH